MSRAVSVPMLWLAGQIEFRASEEFLPKKRVAAVRWGFVGCANTGALRRWNLIYRVDQRTFSSNALPITSWEGEHAARVLDLYRPIAVRRADLPKGSITTAMRSMLGARDLAELAALSLTGGRAGG